jgi:dCTP diphosphatase
VSADMDALLARILAFRRERDWEQFHTGKNLATSIMIEAAELLEHYQWQTEDEPLPPEKRAEAAKELADVFIYLLLFANHLDVDLVQAAEEKLRENQARYPVARARGTAKKYTEL